MGDASLNVQATDESESENLDDRERRVMDWLFSPEAGGMLQESNTTVQEESSAEYERPVSVAKAEQEAVKVLRAAGYGVGARSFRSANALEATPNEGAGSSAGAPGGATAPDPDEARLLRELHEQRAIRLNLLEETIRRMRAENAQTEAELARYRKGSP